MPHKTTSKPVEPILTVSTEQFGVAICSDTDTGKMSESESPKTSVLTRLLEDESTAQSAIISEPLQTVDEADPSQAEPMHDYTLQQVVCCSSEST